MIERIIRFDGGGKGVKLNKLKQFAEKSDFIYVQITNNYIYLLLQSVIFVKFALEHKEKVYAALGIRGCEYDMFKITYGVISLGDAPDLQEYWVKEKNFDESSETKVYYEEQGNLTRLYLNGDKLCAYQDKYIGIAEQLCSPVEYSFYKDSYMLETEGDGCTIRIAPFNMGEKQSNKLSEYFKMEFHRKGQGIEYE